MKKFILAGVLIQSTVALGYCKIKVIADNGATYHYTATKEKYSIPNVPCVLEANDNNDKRSPYKRRFLACSSQVHFGGNEVHTPVAWNVKHGKEKGILHIYWGKKYDRVSAECSGY